MILPSNFISEDGFSRWLAVTIRKVELSKRDRQTLLGIRHKVVTHKELTTSQLFEVERISRRFG